MSRMFWAGQEWEWPGLSLLEKSHLLLMVLGDGAGLLRSRLLLLLSFLPGASLPQLVALSQNRVSVLPFVPQLTVHFLPQEGVWHRC